VAPDEEKERSYEKSRVKQENDTLCKIHRESPDVKGLIVAQDHCPNITTK